VTQDKQLIPRWKERQCGGLADLGSWAKIKVLTVDSRLAFSGGSLGRVLNLTMRLTPSREVVVGRYTFKDLRYTLCRRYIVASRRAARIIVYALEFQN
jgi:hypothetical protein